MDFLTISRFRKQVETECVRCKRTKSELSIIVFDIAAITRAAGSLKKILHFLSKRTRCYDTLGVIGPRRIGLLLPDTSSADARKLANSICDGFTLNMRLTSTIGTYPAQPLTCLEQLYCEHSEPDSIGLLNKRVKRTGFGQSGNYLRQVSLFKKVINFLVVLPVYLLSLKL